MEATEAAPRYLTGTEVATTFTDYLGEQPYVDYTATFDPNTYTVSTAEQRRYLAGFGVHADQEPNGPATYHHGDLIRSTMLLTDQSGAANQMAAYTAFGEMVRPSGTIGYDPNAALPTRYQYAGGWGYESGVISLYGANPNLPPVTLQHVGARWYQPDVGRFVQRDPIGIAGGFNCYAYCAAEPVARIDPEGLYSFGGLTEYWSRKTSEEAYLDLTGGRNSWMDNPKTVARVQWCIDLPATAVTWLAPGVGWVSAAGKAVTVIRWAVKGIDVWF